MIIAAITVWWFAVLLAIPAVLLVIWQLPPRKPIHYRATAGPSPESPSALTMVRLRVPMVIAEIDYLVLDNAGVARELDVIDDLTSGAYEIPDLDVDDLRAARRLVARHQDLKIGLTDAVNAVLAERYDTNEILTTDQRHFRVIIPLTRRFDAFRILPADL